MKTIRPLLTALALLLAPALHAGDIVNNLSQTTYALGTDTLTVPFFLCVPLWPLRLCVWIGGFFRELSHYPTFAPLVLSDSTLVPLSIGPD